MIWCILAYVVSLVIVIAYGFYLTRTGDWLFDFHDRTVFIGSIIPVWNSLLVFLIVMKHVIESFQRFGDFMCELAREK